MVITVPLGSVKTGNLKLFDSRGMEPSVVAWTTVALNSLSEVFLRYGVTFTLKCEVSVKKRLPLRMSILPALVGEGLSVAPALNSCSEKVYFIV